MRRGSSRFLSFRFRAPLVLALALGFGLASSVAAHAAPKDDPLCPPGAKAQFGKLSVGAASPVASAEHLLDRPLTRFAGDKGKIDFKIPREQIQAAQQQLDHQVLNETLFIVPANDGEARRAVDVLEASRAPHLLVSPQGWGATLEKERLPSIESMRRRGIRRVAVMEIPGKADEEAFRKAGLDVVVIDHHAYADFDRRKDRSSLEQLMALINWPMSRTDEALAVNDRSYIPGLKAMGLKQEEMSQVRSFDNLQQWLSRHPGESPKVGEKIVADKVREARRYIDELEPVGKTYLLKDAPDEGIAKEQLAIRSPNGMVNSLVVDSEKVGYSGSPDVVQRLLKYDFEKLGYPPGSYARYGGGDPTASMFFGFKRKSESSPGLRGERSFVPPRVWQEIGKAMEEADPASAKGVTEALQDLMRERDPRSSFASFGGRDDDAFGRRWNLRDLLPFGPREKRASEQFPGPAKGYPAPAKVADHPAQAVRQPVQKMAADAPVEKPADSPAQVSRRATDSAGDDRTVTEEVRSDQGGATAPVSRNLDGESVDRPLDAEPETGFFVARFPLTFRFKVAPDAVEGVDYRKGPDGTLIMLNRNKFTIIKPEIQAGARAAAEDTVLEPEVRKAGLMPRGSAVATSSGNLAKEQGITQIIHAASGSMNRDGPHFSPSLDGVVGSVRNSLLLAKANGHKRVAVPFIGGKIFIDRIGIAPQALVDKIVDTAIEARSGVEIRFVPFGDVDTALFERAVARHKDLPPGAVAVTPGSIIDGKLHGATAIVNAANMEVQFGGGLSGIIARATGNAAAIDREAQEAIHAFYADHDARAGTRIASKP